MADSRAHGLIRIAGAAALALGLFAFLIGPAQGADAERSAGASTQRVTQGVPTEVASASRIGAASVSAPASAYAIIRTIPLPLEGRAVGVGSQVGDPIYVAAGNNFGGQLLRIDAQTLAQTGSVAVQSYPKGLAVSADDTVYVVNADSDTMSVVKGSTMMVSATVGTYDEPQAVAVSRTSDDTIFVSSSGFFSGTYRITNFNARTLARDPYATLGNTASPYGLAVGADDSVYISSYGGNKIFRYEPGTNTVTDAFTGAQGPIGVAVTDSNMIYFSNEVGDVVTRFPAGSPGSAQSVSVEDPQGITIGSDDTIYVAGRDSFRITVIDPQSFTIDDSVTVNGRPASIAVTRTGLVVSANSTGNEAWIVASVRPALSSASGEAGSTGSLTIGGLPAGVVIDDTTVSSVMFDGIAAPGWTRDAGTNTLSGPIPNGTGTAEVTVNLNGGNTASAGVFTYAVPPPPPPPTPASAPLNAVAVPGDASATVSWSAPASSGSYPVTNYLVTPSPAGRICLTRDLSCTVTGLTNGTAYTFTVKALTGAGWSPSSAPSNAVTPGVTPQPSITITGSRDGDRILVTGSTTGFGMGGELKPWRRPAGQASFTQGVATILVGMDGTFEWGRRARYQVSVYVATPDGSLRSNTVTIAAR